MRLHEQLVLEQARMGDITSKPTKEDPKITVPIWVAITKEVAEVFGCRDLIYAGDVMRSGWDKMDLEGEDIDCAIRIEHNGKAMDLIASSVGSYVMKSEGDGPKLHFKVKLTGYAHSVADMLDDIHIDPFEITLEPAQMPLPLAEAKEEADDSERLISPEQAADTRGADTDAPALAAATSLGGTHARRRRGQHKPEAEAAAQREAGRNRPDIVDAEPEPAADDFDPEPAEVIN